MAGRRDDDPGEAKRAYEQSESRFGPTGHDSSTDDRIERLGKRLGRGLSILLAAALILYLWYTYFMH